MISKGVVMIPYDLDPSLHPGEPEKTSLDDGFAPPPTEEALHEPGSPNTETLAPVLSSKSPF